MISKILFTRMIVTKNDSPWSVNLLLYFVGPKEWNKLLVLMRESLNLV